MHGLRPPFTLFFKRLTGTRDSDMTGKGKERRGVEDQEREGVYSAARARRQAFPLAPAPLYFIVFDQDGRML